MINKPFIAEHGKALNSKGTSLVNSLLAVGDSHSGENNNLAGICYLC